MKESIKILIVEDDPDDQEFLIEALGELDSLIEYAIAKDGYEALDQLEKGNKLPDYIFLDLNMPKMNGIQCLQALKANPQWRHVPVVICTTSSSEEQKKVTKELGGFHFLTKPVRVSILRQELEMIFGKDLTVRF